MLIERVFRYAGTIVFAAAMMTACSRVDTARENERALAALAAGKPAEAARILEALCAQEPRHAVLWRNLASSYQAQGLLGEAVGAARRALEISPQDIAARRQAARLAFDAGMYGEVARMYENPGIVRDATEDFVLPALAHQRLGNADTAAAIAERGLQFFSNDYDLLLAAASARADAGDLVAAVDYAERARAVNQAAAAPHILLASLYAARRDADRVQEALATLERLPTRDPRERTQLGQLYLELGRDAMAANEFRWALDADPRALDARLGLATALYKQGKYPEALAACERLLKDAPDLALTHALMGYIYVSRSQRQLAVQALELALRRDPDQPAAQALLERLKAPADAAVTD